MIKQLTAIIEREEGGYVSLCLEFDIASQGDTIEEARLNLQKALELFFETASPKRFRRVCTKKFTLPEWRLRLGEPELLSKNV